MQTLKDTFLRPTLLVTLIWVFASGMGQRPSDEVPVPDADFAATVRDDNDITTKLTHASWDGVTFFTGTRGKGTITISFEKVKKAVIVAGSVNNNKADFQITLRNGEVVAVTFSDDARFSGTTSFGTYRVLAKNIKEIVFD